MFQGTILTQRSTYICVTIGLVIGSVWRWIDRWRCFESKEEEEEEEKEEKEDNNDREEEEDDNNKEDNDIKEEEEAWRAKRRPKGPKGGPKGLRLDVRPQRGP